MEVDLSHTHRCCISALRQLVHRNDDGEDWCYWHYNKCPKGSCDGRVKVSGQGGRGGGGCRTTEASTPKCIKLEGVAGGVVVMRDKVKGAASVVLGQIRG